MAELVKELTNLVVTKKSAIHNQQLSDNNTAQTALSELEKYLDALRLDQQACDARVEKAKNDCTVISRCAEATCVEIRSYQAQIENLEKLVVQKSNLVKDFDKAFADHMKLAEQQAKKSQDLATMHANIAHWCSNNTQSVSLPSNTPPDVATNMKTIIQVNLNLAKAKQTFKWLDSIHLSTPDCVPSESCQEPCKSTKRHNSCLATKQQIPHKKTAMTHSIVRLSFILNIYPHSFYILYFVLIQLSTSDLEVIMDGATNILPEHVHRSKRRVNYDDSYDDNEFPDIPLDVDACSDCSYT